ncbi:MULTISPECIES: hypothetical protein [unclassified Variovorax]|uniref:hypothetical protein n=1 Tax=unclassified Variovorax TaxID=663243 RepID=UPI00076C845C|nr:MULTISPECIES: hypothetical protein [unclassified Variovorax]KWT98295.1 hypothetical protein APY03_0430 [Variovorax sp. WDL1]PNG50050.1 hypothetical protein CHC06_05631 [Variovorax sp. B2]PNG50922.1 hypothetical protein CHC07_05536 [Variovorax sp. B4]VTU41594.1 hypothetical protein SRS16P1_00044 [Variovorax sp. SRS16]VTU41627.1 hypothetical protein E5P1_00044 [Variovorax sp. PBL-E5]
MFSLIITIISIALVAALALATIYYGGTAFNKGAAEAKASQFINEGQQLNGASQLAKTDVEAGTLVAAPATIDDLAPAYLAQVPGTWASADMTLATSVVPSKKVCDAINVKAGLPEAGPADAAEEAAKAFFCKGDGAATPVYTITYKL